MKILMLLLLISTTLLAQNTESTKNWDKTFDIKNLSTYFKENKLNIMLVHSGDYEEEAKLAHISFMKSIKNLKNIKNIISNKDLNNIKNKKDSELISEAEDLHSSLDYYLIIRVYPDQNGDFVLVLSQYNKNNILIYETFAEKGIKIKKSERKKLVAQKIKKEKPKKISFEIINEDSENNKHEGMPYSTSENTEEDNLSLDSSFFYVMGTVGMLTLSGYYMVMAPEAFFDDDNTDPDRYDNINLTFVLVTLGLSILSFSIGGAISNLESKTNLEVKNLNKVYKQRSVKTEKLKYLISPFIGKDSGGFSLNIKF